MPWLSDFPALSPSRRLYYKEKQAVLMFARRYPLLGRARAGEVAGIWAEELRPDGNDASAEAVILGIARAIIGGG